jgi:hypothetical protein
MTSGTSVRWTNWSRADRAAAAGWLQGRSRSGYRVAVASLPFFRSSRCWLRGGRAPACNLPVALSAGSGGGAGTAGTLVPLPPTANLYRHCLTEGIMVPLAPRYRSVVSIAWLCW